MKITALLETPISKGGAFHQGINAIKLLQRACGLDHELQVVTTHTEDLPYLKELGISAVYYRISLRDKLTVAIGKSELYKLAQRLFNLVSPLEKYLLRSNTSLAYLLSQTRTASLLSRTPYITTVFDICHRDFPEFPEVRELGQFAARDEEFRHSLPQAVLVITDSEQLSSSLAEKYGVDAARMIAVPYDSAELCEQHSEPCDEVLARYKLEPGYFFYPAQFWPHKNHMRIIQALSLLKARDCQEEVVFVGGDKGIQSHLEQRVVEAGLQGQVHFLGFAPQRHMRGLYSGCGAVLMPTYFGPTNLPPLEAWTLGKPLIYSSHLRCHGGDAALYADPDSAEELANAMQASAVAETRENLKQLGRQRLHLLESRRAASERSLKKFLGQFAARRQCWP